MTRAGFLLSALLYFLWAAFAPLPSPPADDPSDEPAWVGTRWMQVRRRVIEEESLARVFAAEKALIAAGTGDAQAGPDAPVREKLGEPIRELLSKDGDGRGEALVRIVSAAEAELQSTELRWKASVRELRQVSAELDRAGRESSHGDLSFPELIGGGIVVALCGVLLALYDARLGVRRWLRFRAAALHLLAVALLTSGCSGGLPATPDGAGRGRVRLDDECRELENQLSSLTEKNALRAAEVSGKQAAVLAGWVAVARRPDPPGDARLEDSAYGPLHRALAALCLDARLADDARTLEGTAEEGRGELARLRDEQPRRALTRRGLRAGMSLCFIALGAFPLYRTRRRLRARQARDADTCPRCLARGTLRQRDSTALDPRYPAVRVGECSECDYRFRAGYARLPRLCFPAIGAIASGKTLWLVTVYDLIKHHRLPVAAAVSSSASLGVDTFDRLAEQVLQLHRSPAATHYDLPYPLTFHVRDGDRLAPSQALLGLFDFAGEVMSQPLDYDRLRRRALLMDGCVLFLDPTQVREGAGGPGLGAQVKALMSFFEDAREMHHLEVGTKLPMPVAVCLSKLDLLVNRNPLGSAAIPWLRRLQETAGDSVSLSSLRRRSALCEEVLPFMFPGWDVVRTLRENCGGGVLLFPMTSVGLVEYELGIDNLEARTIVPFGVLEPVLWLLHMQGLSILSRG